MRAVLAVLGVVWGSLNVFGQDMNTMKNMPKYDTRYDYLEVDTILDSKRLVRNYVDCLVNLKPCTPEGKALKRILPEALRTKCVRCTEKQKKTAVKVIKRLKCEYPEEWKKLSSRWDPTGDFTRFFEEFLAKEQFNIIGTGDQEQRVSMPPLRPYPPPQYPTPQVVVVSPSTPPPVYSSPRPTMPSTMRPPMSTTTRPIVVNRFGEDGELMIGGSTRMPPQTMASSSTDRSVTMLTSWRPTMQTRPSEPMPTRFPLRPVHADLPDPYSTAITLIDQIGYKIMRTTELVTDILRNTVRAVVNG